MLLYHLILMLMKKFRFAFMSLPLLLFIPSCTNDGEKAKGCSPWNDSIIKGTDFESHSKTKLLANEIASSNKKVLMRKNML